MCLGVPGRIIAAADEDQRLALVDFEGVRRKVNVMCVLDAERAQNVHDLVGCWVLVHVGFALSVIDENEAAETLAILAELGEVEEELAVMRASEQG